MKLLDKYPQPIGVNTRKMGFTLIEVLLCLIIMGIMGSIWGIGLSEIVDKFSIARASAKTVQDVQMALCRMEKEFSWTTQIPSANQMSVRYVSGRDGLTHVLNYDSISQKLVLDGGVLLDNVHIFRLEYYDQFDDPPPNPNDITGGFSPATTMIRIVANVAALPETTIQFADIVLLRKMIMP